MITKIKIGLDISSSKEAVIERYDSLLERTRTGRANVANTYLDIIRGEYFLIFVSKT